MTQSPLRRTTVGKAVPWLVGALGVLLAGFIVGRGCGQRQSEKDLAEANQRLASAEQTIKLKDGLFAEKLNEMRDLQTILEGQTTDLKNLREQLQKSREQLLTVQQIAVQWKKKYEDYVAAHQSEEPGPDGTVRKRVDFAGDLGPFHAEGHTLTDPPEAFLSILQTRALHLAIAVAQGKDGKWNTYVSSDDPDVDVDIQLAGVDPYVLSPSWKERLRIDIQALPFGEGAIGYGVSYDFQRWSLGLGCSSSFGSNSAGTSCGLTFGFRPFK